MKILVADRQEDLRAVLDILEKTPGNEIQAASTGEEALALAQTHGVDLLITEVFIEPMNGFTLRNKMENRHPGVRTIFVSGYDLSPYTEHTLGYEIVTKPVTPHGLFQAIARSKVGVGQTAPAPAPAPSAAPAAVPPPAATQMPLPLQRVPAPTPTPTRIPLPSALAQEETPAADATAAAIPVATPRATPAQAATPVAVPRAIPAQAATPVAVPRAIPAQPATPVAVPRAIPAQPATPVAVPRAIPTQPATPVAVPRAIPAPTATSVAVPRAIPAQAATPVAVPRATPSQPATPVAVPRAIPAQAATPVAVPRATPEPTATPVAVPRAIPAPTATPVAVPRATPEPTATPVAVPRAIPAPAATPIAVPRATPEPTATPVAVPRATASPAITPVAVPRATPAPAPTRVNVPRVTPAPAATAAAVPRAIPAPTAAPAAVPKATPVPTATPAAMPRAAAAPVVTPVAVPRAAPVASATPAALPKAAPAPVSASDPLLGKTLGSYRIERRLGNGKWGSVYFAIQTSMNRPVAMEVLSADRAGNETARQNFVATARAKAAVQHPHILSVYEADQAEGHYFYTHEYVDGFNLAQLKARDEGLSEPVALQTIKSIAQGLSHLHQQQIGHSAPTDTDIYIGADGLPYLSNVALPGQQMQTPQEEIRALGALIRDLLPNGQAEDRGLQAMLTRMSVTTQAGFQSWPALFQAIQAIEPKVIPADAFKLSAQDQAAIHAVEEARKRQKMQVIFSIVGFFVFLCVMGLLVWWNFMRPTTHDYSNEMVEIPAGQFIYQDGQKLILPAFYIDKYDVTMAEYAKFIDYLAQHNNTTEFDNPQQPAGRSHTPYHWDIYYGRASSSISAYHTVRGVPITLDCPVFNVDYFDAYAYAKWKGRRLPTEQEWEKAARGPNGNLYPWGNAWDPKKTNAGGDYMAQPPDGYKPGVDGYNWWAPVDAFPTDRSEYGVIGMAGNVSEWTDSWDATKTYPVIRGGNFKSTQDKALTTAAIRDAYPDKFAETLGFRTASDKPPAK